MSTWAGPDRALYVATVDHGLRPEAAGEAMAVAALCARLGIAHQTLIWRPNHSVAQAEARQARHGLLAQWAQSHRLPVVSLGHTRNDRIETFLIRARAGSHWRGLAGPMPSAPSPVWPQGLGVRLARPLLAFARSELRDYLKSCDVTWNEDPSNHAAKYERVRMRRLTELLDGAAQMRIIAIMNRLAELRSAIAASAREALRAHVRTERGAGLLEAAVLQRLTAEARLRLIEALVMAAGGSPLPPETGRLKRLTRRLSEPGGIGQGATLAGAWVKETGLALCFEPAPARRISTRPPPKANLGVAPSPLKVRPAGFCLERAQALLADPRTAAFGV